MKWISFNVWARYFVWNFKGYLWNSTQNILPIHWKMWILFTSENLRALRFKSSKVFLKRPPGLVHRCACRWCGSLVLRCKLRTAKARADLIYPPPPTHPVFNPGDVVRGGCAAVLPPLKKFYKINWITFIFSGSYFSVMTSSTTISAVGMLSCSNNTSLT